MDLGELQERLKGFVTKIKAAGRPLHLFEAKDVEMGIKLGEGGEGIVHMCNVTYSHMQIKAAAKMPRTTTSESLDHTLAEVELLCLAQDPIVNAVVRVYGVAALPDMDDEEIGNVAVITEAGLMDVLQLFLHYEIPMHVLFDIWSQTAEALHCLHVSKILHLDLKPQNILVTGLIRDAEGNIEKVHVKLIDLGLGQVVEGRVAATGYVMGTIGFHAPEMLLGCDYDTRADLFMLGITLCILLLPKSTLKKNALITLLKKIHAEKVMDLKGEALFEKCFTPLIIVHLSADIKGMLCTLLEAEEKRKITLVEVARMCKSESRRLKTEQLIMSQSEMALQKCRSAGSKQHEDATVKLNQFKRPGPDQEIQAANVAKRQRSAEEKVAKLSKVIVKLTIRIRRPDGSTILVTTLTSEDSLDDLLNFLAACDFEMKLYKLIQAYPRRDLMQMGPSLKLSDLKFNKQEMLFIEKRPAD